MPKATLYLLASLVIVLDQLTKRWAVGHLAMDDTSVVLIPSVLYFTRTSNTGSAFGLFPGSTIALAAVALIAVVAIAFYVARRKDSIPWLTGIALALPLGGALGNFIDRVRLGSVVDFVDLRIGSYHWPVFNVADSCICIGVALLAFNFLRSPQHEPVKLPDASAVEPSPDAAK